MTDTPERWRSVIGAATLLLSALLLFARLGQYALWDDEAYTALDGQGVWRTGDTSAINGQNIVAFRRGRMLRNFEDRFEPPLQAYVVAPFTAVAGTDTAMVRLPFAVCGLCTIALIFRWLARARASWRMTVLTGMLILGNVSLYLYCRQCRYYGLVFLLSVWIAYVYLHWDGGRRGVIVLAVLSIALLAANLGNYAVLCAVLGVDYVFWGRKRHPLRAADWVWLLLPQLLVGGMILYVWTPLALNPFAVNVAHGAHQSVADRLEFVWRFVRDMNACEFGATAVLLALPVAYALTRDIWLLRGGVALALFVTLTAMLSPEEVRTSRFADVRYVSPTIVLCVVLTAAILAHVRWAVVGLALGAVACTTNLFNGGPWLASGLRCTVAQYVRELASPPPDPYRAASNWINANVPEGGSIWVMPEYATLPLMFHAPGALYAWQLNYPPEAQFQKLAPIYFAGQGRPDFAIAFGPQALATVLHVLAPYRGYELVDQLPVNGAAAYRPELMARSFTALPCDLRSGEGIYCFRLRPGP